MELEHFSELLGKLRDIWHQAAVKHGGLVIRTQGDGVLGDFRLPPFRRGRQPACRRGRPRHPRMGFAVAARRCAAGSLPLRMHSGIHAGTLLLAEGDIEWGRFDLIGDVVNTAAHLSRHAAPGQILANLDALG